MVSRDKFEKILLFSVFFVISTTVLSTFPTAFADNVQDSIVDGTTITKFPGESFTTRYFVTPSNNQGNSDPAGCNIGTVPGEVATVTLTIVATIGSLDTLSYTPNPITISGCQNENGVDVTFTSLSGGRYEISAQTTDSDVNDYSTNGNFVLEFVDNTPPVIEYSISGTLGNNGWYTSDVFVDWTVTEPESPLSLVTVGCVDTTIDYDTIGEVLTCDASSDGGIAPTVSVTIQRDVTAPSVTGTPDRAANSAGWYNAPVTVTWSGEDATSGIESCSAPSDYSGPDSDTASVTGTCTDNAGNVGNGSFDLDYDATPPTVTPPPNVTFAAVGITGAAPVTYAAASFDDNLSGLDGTESSTPASGSSLPVGLNTITHTATDNAGNTASATSTANVFDVRIDPPGIINQGSEVYVYIKDQAKDTSDSASETVTFNVRSAAGDAAAQAGFDVDATAQLPDIEPFSFTFNNPTGSLVVTSEATDPTLGAAKLNLGNDGYDTITVRYTSTDGVFKEVSADTQLAGGGGRPATAADPFRWSSDRYLIETTGTLKAFDANKKGNSVADTIPAQVATSTASTTFFSVTLTEDPGDTGTFTSPAITFSSTLASSFTGGIFRLNTPVGSTVTGLADLDGTGPATTITVTAAIDGLTIPTTGAIAVTTTSALCSSFGGDTDNDGICNNWENQSVLAGLNVNHISSAVYSYACKPQIDDTAGNPTGSRYSVHSTSPPANSLTTSNGCPSVYQRDVYLEMDWMNGHKPNRDAIAKVIDTLATAPDPDGSGPILPGIKLHVQLDESYGFHRDQINFNRTPPTLTENYNVNTGWTTVPSTGTQVTVDSATFPDVVKFNAATDGADKRVHKPLASIPGGTPGLTLDNTQWKMESTFTPTAATSPNHFIYVLQAGNANPDTTTQDRIGVAYKVATTNKLMLFRADGTATETFGTGITAAVGSTYYITVERTSATNVKLSVFSNAERITHVSGSPVNLTIPSTITGLTTLQHSVASSGATSASLTASIDNTTIYNGFNPGFQDLKLVYFGKITERVQTGKDANFISNYLSNKRQVFHYGAPLHDLIGRVCTSGLGEVGGNDFVTTLGCFTGNIGSVDEQAGTILHELGHNFNLDHLIIGQPNYLSVMNYAFQFTYPITDRPLDFSRSALPTLDEVSGLSETLGIGLPPLGPSTTYPPTTIPPTLNAVWRSLYGPETGLPVSGALATGPLTLANNPIDWDRDGIPGEIVTGLAVHNMPSVGATDSTPTALYGRNDYTALDLNFRDSSFFSDGFSGFLPEQANTAVFTSDFDHDTPFAKQITAPIDAFAKGTSQSVSGLLEDPDGSSETYTASWIWGDGTTSPGTVSAPFTPLDAVLGDETKDATVDGAHTYSSQGRYSLSLTVNDSESHSSTTEFPVYMMVTDPTTRNRVSSSSTISSPSGAYRSPTGDNDNTGGTVGPVTITFGAQYKNGVVSGNLGFNLKATDGTSLELKNSKLNWAVIITPTSLGVPAASNSLEAHAKGTASIQGRTGTYGFVISAVDGNPTGGTGVDKMRVRIYDPAIGNEHDLNAIIYDNQCLDPDGSITGAVSCDRLYGPATTILSSGTVTIQ